MRMIEKKIVLLLCIVVLHFGCGGGGGGGGVATSAQPTTAVIKISTAGTLASGVQIGGIDVTVELSSGVTISATPFSATSTTLVAKAGTVVPSGGATGSNTYAVATYVPAAGTARGKIAIHIVNPNGFAAGDFVTVHCDISAGYNPPPNDFSLFGFYATDTNGSALSSLSVIYTASIQ